MKEKILKIILKLVWFKKIASGFEILTSTQFSLTDCLKPKSILHKP